MQPLFEEICQHLRNWFCDYNSGDVYAGSFTITSGTISGQGKTKTPPIESGMYYRIIGSYKTNGVYKAGTDTPADDTFNGQVWLLHPPAAFLALYADIKAWQEKNGGAESANMSPFTSESFGGYSYSKSGSGNGGAAATWQGQFNSRLNTWRKI